MRRGAVRWIVVTLLWAGCRPETDSPGVVVRDSAGVTLVESAAPVARGALAVGARPAVDIGGRGAPSAEFPAYVSAIRLRSGSIVAAGWATHSLRYFDSTGRFVDSVGREGSGPGEFEALGWLYHGAGDTLLTYEPTNRRVQLFDPAGRFLGLAPLPPTPDSGATRLLGLLGDGALLVRVGLVDREHSTADVEARTLRFYRQDRSTGRARLAFELPDGPNLKHPVYAGGYYGRPLFATVPLVGIGPRGVATMSSDRMTVAWRRPDGGIVRIVRAEHPPRRLTDSRFEAKFEAAVAEAPKEWRDRFRARLARTGRPKLVPVAGELVVGEDGRLWVQSLGDGPFDVGGAATVFDPDGRWETDLSLPADFVLEQAGADWILGVRPDAEDFYHILLYRLRRPAPSGAASPSDRAPAR